MQKPESLRKAGLSATLCALAVIAMSGASVRAAEPVTSAGLTARGVIAPRVEATLSAQISARIARLPVERGQAVAAGDVLAEFDCTLEKARLRGAKADHDGAKARLVNLQRLDHMGSVGKVDVQIAAADVDKAAAMVEERQSVLRFCVVTAPFSGVVVDVPAHAHESIEAGKPLVSLLDDHSLQVVMLAPSTWAAWLAPGLPLSFVVDETGEQFPATVTRLDGRIDPGSQTITVFAEPRRNGAETALLAGMTGSAVFAARPGSSAVTQ